MRTIAQCAHYALRTFESERLDYSSEPDTGSSIVLILFLIKTVMALDSMIGVTSGELWIAKFIWLHEEAFYTTKFVAT